ncbi:MAG: hypothetical protein ACK5AM_14925, partial [Pirellulaceae bacterium]
LQTRTRSNRGLRTLFVISIAALVAIVWLGVVRDDAGAQSMLSASRSLPLDIGHCGSIGYW